MACYIYQLPSWVLDDLCRNIDTLSEWDWMQFGEFDTTYSQPGPEIDRSMPPPYMTPPHAFPPTPAPNEIPEAGECLLRTLLLCFSLQTDLELPMNLLIA